MQKSSKTKKVPMGRITELESKDTIQLPYSDLREEAIDIYKKSINLQFKTHEIIKSSFGPDGTINMRDAAGIANLLMPIIKVSDIVQEMDFKNLYTHLEEMLLKNGATRTPDSIKE